MVHCHAHPYWTAEVGHIDDEMRITETHDKFFDNGRHVVEGGRELVSRRRVAIPHARVVWRHHMEIIGQQRNQISELVRRRGKAVQQKQCWLRLLSCFPVENLDALNGGVMV